MKLVPPAPTETAEGDPMTFRLPDVIPEGRRNDMLTRRAGQLRRLGADETLLIEGLIRANEAHCRPPLGEREVKEIARHVARYPVGPAPGWPHPRLDPLQRVQRRGARLVGGVTKLAPSKFSVRFRRGAGSNTVDLAMSSGPSCSCARFRAKTNVSGSCADIEAVRAWLAIHYGGLEVAAKVTV
jgi:Primase C terminal 1 (PriCT-1)